MTVVSVLCCRVVVCASGLSIVQMSPMERDVSMSVIVKPSEGKP